MGQGRAHFWWGCANRSTVTQRFRVSKSELPRRKPARITVCWTHPTKWQASAARRPLNATVGPVPAFAIVDHYRPAPLADLCTPPSAPCRRSDG
jgi:hypothetical protein